MKTIAELVEQLGGYVIPDDSVHFSPDMGPPSAEVWAVVVLHEYPDRASEARRILISPELLRDSAIPQEELIGYAAACCYRSLEDKEAE